MSNPFTGTNNPFMNRPVITASLPPAKLLPPCGDPRCTANHRPNGEHYDSDKVVRMAQLKADGKMGPQFGVLGGAKAKSRKRATEVIADSAAEHADKIQRVFMDGIDESQPIGVRLNAAKEWLKVASNQDELDLKQRQAEYEQMSKDELISDIQDALARLSEAGAIAQEVEQQIIDAEVVDGP